MGPMRSERDDVTARPDGAPTGVTASEGRITDPDASTRHRVTETILHHGPSTAAELAQRLELTPAAIRRHLTALTDEGLIVAADQRVYGTRGRGRPAKVFSLTDAGRADFVQGYDQLAIQALQFLAERDGDAVRQFAGRRVAGVEARYRELLDESVTGDRTEALAEALTADGYAASTRPAAAGTQLCQHHCPVAHVAEEFPELCEVETEIFARLLGVHVQRLATIAHGDGVCTTHIPRTPDQPGRTEAAPDPVRDTASTPTELATAGTSTISTSDVRTREAHDDQHA